MNIRGKKLIPYARQRIKDSVATKDVSSDDFRESLAEELFQMHRGSSQTEFRSQVRERTWSEIPNSQRGKYRKMVAEALEAHRRSVKRQRKSP